MSRSDDCMTNRRPTLMWTTRTLLLAVGLVVTIAPAYARASGAKAIVQRGQDSLANGGLFKALSVGDRVNARRLIITGPDGYARLEVLSDGSTFEVFPNSRDVFRETPGNWAH